MADNKSAAAMQFFKSRGYSHEQASGIVGNLIGESNLNTGAVGDGGRAKGLAQWHADRWNHMAHGPFNGRDLNDFTTQLEMVDWELRNRETRAYGQLKNATTVEQATAAFIGFERPRGFTWSNPRGGHNFSGRLSFAHQVSGGGVPATAQSTPLPTYTNPTHDQTPSTWSATAPSAMENPVVSPYTTNSTAAPAPQKPAPSFTEVAGAALSENWALANIWPQTHPS